MFSLFLHKINKMRSIVFHIVLATVLTLTFQSIVSAEKVEEPMSDDSATAVSEKNGRNGGMMMNMTSSASVGHGNGKKDSDMLDIMNKIIMMVKNYFETIVMFVDPIVKVKTFGLDLIKTLIEVAKFIMQWMDWKNKQMKHPLEIGNTIISEDRLGIPYGSAFRPTYLAHYPSFMHKYKMPS